ncbi:MAG: PEP-CTERM sorting domain-containing protein [Cyanobacteria bacterium J06559_3]
MHSTLFLGSALLTTTVAMLSLAAPGQAAALWNEATDGDLSNEELAPTSLGELLPGSNVLDAVFNAGTEAPDPDYFSFVVPEGSVLTGIELLSWETEPTFEDIAFFAVQSGSIFDFVVPEDRSNANGLLGWSHLRSTQVGTNKVLIELGASSESHIESGVAEFYEEEVALYPDELIAEFPELPDNLVALTDQWVPGAAGFDIPLEAGTYSFWLRQGSDVRIATGLDFQTAPVSTPEPTGAIALIALVLGTVAAKRQPVGQQR